MRIITFKIPETLLEKLDQLSSIYGSRSAVLRHAIVDFLTKHGLIEINPESESEDAYATLDTFAKLTGLSKTTVRELIERGIIEAEKVYDTYIIPLSEISKLKNKCEEYAVAFLVKRRKVRSEKPLLSVTYCENAEECEERLKESLRDIACSSVVEVIVDFQPSNEIINTLRHLRISVKKI